MIGCTAPPFFPPAPAFPSGLLDAAEGQAHFWCHACHALEPGQSDRRLAATARVWGTVHLFFSAQTQTPTTPSAPSAPSGHCSLPPNPTKHQRGAAPIDCEFTLPTRSSRCFGGSCELDQPTRVFFSFFAFFFLFFPTTTGRPWICSTTYLPRRLLVTLVTVTVVPIGYEYNTSIRCNRDRHIHTRTHTCPSNVASCSRPETRR